MISITLLIILLTFITSIIAFNNPKVKQQLIFSPYLISRNKEWYRFLSAGFIHNDWPHLILNMLALYLFGTGGLGAENHYAHHFGDASATLYILLYILAIILSEVFSYFRYENAPYFASLGASGAVSAIIFSNILFAPYQRISLLFLPVGVPGFIFGILFLLFSMHMARRGHGTINHYAHFFGAVFGFVFPIVLKPALFMRFIHQFTHGY